MEHEIINLKKYYPLQNEATLEAMCPQFYDWETPLRPALIIVPGGGYGFVGYREGDPVALSFMLKGYNCFVLRYTVKNEQNPAPIYPKPQLELLAAMDYVKKNAEQFHIDGNKVFMVGFSAGGHLVGSYSYLYKEIYRELGIDKCEHLKPTGICLSYPVITMTDSTHGDTRAFLTNLDKKLCELNSIENHVGNDYPPTYLWGTENDNCVPSENFHLMEEALNNAGVKNKTHIFPDGVHGLSICTESVQTPNKECSVWVDECDEFFKSI